MIILHEIPNTEAEHIGKIVSDVYKIPVELQKKDLSDWFKPLPEFNGYWDSVKIITKKVDHNAPDRAVMILTDRDLYYGNHSADDEWIFGYCSGNIQVVSNARMKGVDSRPTHELMVSKEQYMKRFVTMVIHELGHDLVQDKHMKKAYWVNAKDNKKYPLGEHCTNNACVMYEVVDMLTPSASAGYLLIGGKKKYDAGLDEHITRLSDSWFCDVCQNSMIILKEYTVKTKR